MEWGGDRDGNGDVCADEHGDGDGTAEEGESWTGLGSGQRHGPFNKLFFKLNAQE